MQLKTTRIKLIAIFLKCILLLSCGPSKQPENTLSWEKQFEEITRVEFPENYKVIAKPSDKSADLVKKAIIELSSKDCPKFYKNYDFKPVEDSISPSLFGSELMDSIYRSIPDRSKFLHRYDKRYESPKYFKYNTEKTANWVYLLDTTTCRLYCIISNADISGYAK